MGRASLPQRSPGILSNHALAPAQHCHHRGGSPCGTHRALGDEGNRHTVRFQYHLAHRGATRKPLAPVSRRARPPQRCTRERSSPRQCRIRAVPRSETPRWVTPPVPRLGGSGETSETPSPSHARRRDTTQHPPVADQPTGKPDVASMPLPCRHFPLFASNSPVSVACDQTESPLPADDPHDSLLPPFVTRVARDNPPSPAPAPPQLRASSPIGYPIRLTRSRRLRSLDAHRHARPRHVRLHRPAAPLRPFSAPPPSDCPAPRAHCTAAGGADPRSPQHPPLTVHPHLSSRCYPTSDSLPRSRDSARSCRDRPHRRSTTATSRPVPPTKRRTRWITAAPPPPRGPLLARSQQ
jgi:hypothetical protein